ncbi:O-antigen ligase family protein [Streptomyces sp. 6N223]|uniref:O-antigen ligase family protein n=1 Tax=Streptomyces sp. 6N223 TaxID=3457412 RepID=UPI003FCF11E4
MGTGLPRLPTVLGSLWSLASVWPALPAAATVALLCLPVGAAGTAADLASLALVAVCVVAVAVTGARESRSRQRPGGPALGVRAAVLLGAPAVAFAVATAASGDPAASVSGFARCLQVFVLVPLSLVLLLRARREAWLVAGCVVAAAVVEGAVGTVQYATGTGASYMGENIRAVGTFGPQNVMGMATVVSYGLVIAVCLGLAPPARAPRWCRPAAFGCAALLAVPLAVSFSRGAWLATAAAVAVVVLAVVGGALAVARRRRLVLAFCAGGLLLAGGAVGVGAAASGMVGDRLSSIGQAVGLGEEDAAPDQSVTDRYAMWSAALEMWWKEPLTGVGPRGFAAHRDSHASLALSSGSDTGGAGAAFARQELLSPHNMYLLLLGEQGLLGAATVVGCWAGVGAACAARLRRARHAGRDLGLGLAAIGLLTWQAVNFLYADIGGPTTVLTAMALGLAAWWGLAPAAAPAAGAAAAGRQAPP